MARASVIVLLLLTLASAGCVKPPPEHPPEGAQALAPVEGTGRMSLDVNGYVTDYRGEGDLVVNGSHWEMTKGAAWDRGVFILPAVLTENGTMLAEFTLRFRIDEPHPLQLAFNETLALTNTFNFTYSEGASWAGRDTDLARVVSVSNESWLDVFTWERQKARLSGKFHLDFVAASEDGSVTERIVLDGRFPVPREH